MFASLPGFREFYPDDCAVRNHLFRLWRQTAVRHGFAEYDAPVLEPLDLYTEKSGPEIVGQLFAFQDRGERHVALRPEMTPSLARLVGAKAAALKRPIKWFSIGEMYRFERPQKGRTRAFYQFNADILGETTPAADAELMALCVETFRAFGLGPADVALRLSDRTLWLLYLEALGKAGADALPVLSALDKFDPRAPEANRAALAPHFGELAEPVRQKFETLQGLRELGEIEAFFAAHVTAPEAAARVAARLADWRVVLAHLRAFGLEEFVRVDLSIVRGLAYYTGFVFEVFERAGRGRALAGGGRYDDLVGKLGYNPLPATGFAAGDVTLTDLLREKGLLHLVPAAPEVFVIAWPGEDERALGLQLVGALRRSGLGADYSLRGGDFSKQMKAAGQSGARAAALVGARELAEGRLKLKDLTFGREQSVPVAEALQALRQLLEDGWPEG